MKLIETLRPPHNERGVALLIALAVLVLMAILAVSFYTRQNLESAAAENARNARSAEAIAHGGLEWAITLLQKDEELGYDTNYDIWGPSAWEHTPHYPDANKLLFNTGSNNDVDFSDLDDPDVDDARFIVVRDQFRVIGRFAAIIEDESGKVNVNVAGNRENRQGNGLSPAEIKLAAILTAILPALGEEEAKDIIYFRNGGGWIPGGDGDDDGDGPLGFLLCDDDVDGNIDEHDEAVNEPDERNVYGPAGGDMVLLDLTTLKLGVPSMVDHPDYFNAIRPYITVDSQTQNVYKADPVGNALDDWHDQVAVNVASMEVIYGALDKLRKAGRLPDDEDVLRQTAVNIADFIDDDSEPQEYRVVGHPTCYGIEKTAYINEVEASPKPYKKNVRGEVVDVLDHGEFIELINPYRYPGTGDTGGVTVTLRSVPRLVGAAQNITVKVPWARGDNPGYYVIGDTSGTYVFEDGSADPEATIGPEPMRAHKHVDLDLESSGTIVLETVSGNTIEEAKYPSGGSDNTNTAQKNDPRVNEWSIAARSLNGQNNNWNPRVGGELDRTPSLADAFVVYNSKLGSVGLLGLVHRGEPWSTIDLTWPRGEDENWEPHEHETWLNVLDVFTTEETIANNRYGLININTAPRKVLIGLKGIDPDSIATHVTPTRRFETIGELGYFLSRASSSRPVTPAWKLEKPLADVAGLVTVRSHVLRVTVLAQAIDRQGHKTAERKLEATVLRTINTGTGLAELRVLSMRWIPED